MSIKAKRQSQQNDLQTLLLAIQAHPKAEKLVKTFLNQKNGLRVLLQGSGYIKNIDTLHEKLKERNNLDDSFVMVDIDHATVQAYTNYIQTTYPHLAYTVIEGDINELPFPDDSMHVVIHTFTVNFNRQNRDDTRTIAELKRVLKIDNSICLFSVAVLPAETAPLSYASLSGTAVLQHTGAYYESLFTQFGFNFICFETNRENSLFPYNRYILYSHEAANSS